MRSIRTIRGLGFAICAVLLLGGTVSAAQAEDRPAISVTPPETPPSTSFRVDGTDFTPGATVEIYFDSRTLLGKPSVLRDGTFSKGVRVPRSATPGDHTVSAVSDQAEQAAATLAVGTNWAQFHFDRKHSGANGYENTIGTGNVSQLTQEWAWRTLSASSPVRGSGGRIFVGDSDGTLLSLDEKTGSGLWEGDNGFASPISLSPALYQDLVLVVDDDGGVDVFPATCSTPCAPLTYYYPGKGIFVGAPTVSNGLLYLVSDAPRLLITDAGCTSNCQAMYQFDLPAAPAGSPSIGTDIWVSAGDTVYRYPNPCSWGCTNIGYGIADGVLGTPAVTSTTIYVASNEPSGSNLYAFPATCPWNCSPIWTASIGSGGGSVPAVANGKVYVGGGSNLYAFPTSCLNPCSPLWAAPLGGAVTSSPVVANGVVYVGSDSGLFFAVSATSGVTLWTEQFISPMTGSPAVANGQVFVPAGSLVAYGLP